MRSTTLTTLLLSTMLILVVPSATADVRGDALVGFTSPAQADLDLDLTVTGEDARTLRVGVDENGNGDGTVSEEEVTAFEDFLKGFFDNPDATTGSEMTVDGQNASSTSLTRFEILDAEGDVNSTEPVRYELVLAIEWPVTPGDRHTFVSEGRGEGAAGSSNLTLTIRAPPDYGIESTDGLPDGADVSSSEIRYAGDQASGDNVTVVFSKGAAGAGGGVPGPGVAALLAVTVGVAAWRRR